MQAKDTLMSDDTKCDLADAFMVVYPRLQLKGQNALLNLIDEATIIQAEISFKAGIKDVVEWVEIVPPVYKLPEGNMEHYVISIEQWQNKLKEWGTK